MYRTPVSTLALLATALIGCGEPDAEDAPAQPEPSYCGAPQCEITLEHLARISDEEDPGILPPFVIWVQRDGAGRLFTPSLDHRQVVVFDSDGTLLTLIGREGQGPGEFTMVRTLSAGPGDTIYAMDWMQGRLSLIGPDLTVNRTIRAPNAPSLVLDDGTFIVASTLGANDGTAYPIHVVDQEGTILRSFGTDDPTYHPEFQLSLQRQVAPSADGSIWSVAIGRYVLERWDPLTGERVQQIQVNSDWFVESASYNYDLTVRPHPIVEGLWEDDEGLIWVILRDADRGWAAPARGNEERSIDEEEYDATYDWILEVVDPSSGKVIASRRYPDLLWYRSPSRILVSHADTDINIVAFDVWEAKLQPARVR